MFGSTTQTVLACVLTFALAIPVRAADNYAVDTVHSAVSFRIQHAGIAYVHGRFNEFSGNFQVDKSDPSKSSFSVSIKTESVDTNNRQRDNHLRSPDFFNAKQFPAITFQSTAVKPVNGGWEVTGDLNLHGVAKPITFMLQGGKEANFQGRPRIGFWADVTLKRSEFGMKGGIPMTGDDVHVSVSLEGIKK